MSPQWIVSERRANDHRDRQGFHFLVHSEWGEDFQATCGSFQPEIHVGVLHRVSPGAEAAESRNGTIVAGIAVFGEKVPEHPAILLAAQTVRSRGAFYLGYLVVDRRFRLRGLGSEFFSRFLDSMPHRVFWLVIEDPMLQSFYKKFSFRPHAEVCTNADSGKMETILIRDPSPG